jgi:hypothetical protein
LLADSDAAEGDKEWRRVASSMVKRILPDRTFPCSSSFVGDVGVVKSSNADGSDTDREQFMRSNGVSRVSGISEMTKDLFSVIA